MSKFGKSATSFMVFVFNLILMGVGFLFIKNSEEAKKQPKDMDFSEAIPENISVGSDVVLDNSLNQPQEMPKAENQAEAVQDTTAKTNSPTTDSKAPAKAVSPAPTTSSSSSSSSSSKSSSTSSKKKSKSSSTTKTS